MTRSVSLQVVALVNLIYIMRMGLSDYDSQKQTPGRRHIMLY